MMVLFFAAVTLLVQIGKEFQPTGVLTVGRIWLLTAERQELFDYLGEIVQEYLE